MTVQKNKLEILETNNRTTDRKQIYETGWDPFREKIHN